MDRRMPGYGEETDSVLVVMGIGASIGLHGAIVAAVWLTFVFGGEDKKPEAPKMEFEKVELLALGEKKPKTRLPRKANPKPPPKTKKDEVNIAEKTEPEPEKKPEAKKDKKKKQPENKKPEVKDKREPKEEPKKEPSSPDDDEERNKRREKLLEMTQDLHNPNRPTNEDTPEGSPEGVAGGRLSNAAVKNLLGTFQAKVMQRVSGEWTIPSTISQSEVKKLEGQVVVYVELSSSGHIRSYEFKKKSSNEQFNNSIDRVLKKFTRRWGSKKIPLPEKQKIRRIILREGLNLTEWKYTGR